jgi:FKBP-type peptidyl-prolyl cis-trans isomerase
MAGMLGRLVPAGVIGMALIGCDSAPDIMPMAPPGAQIPRKAPEGDTAQAQGEMPVALSTADVKPASTETSTPPALPTAIGGIKTTPGGVKYETLKEGTGPELKAGQTGEFIYEGKLEDGTVFDGDTKRDRKPATYPLGRMIGGWQEGLPGMKVGEVRKLTIPPDKGYGAGGFGDKIPPNATLIFEVELVGIPGQ